MAVKAKPEPREAVLPPPKPFAEDPAERAAALKAISDTRRVTAWAIHRYPLTKHILHARTRVHLPRRYLAPRTAIDVRLVHADTDLNLFLYEHYLECLPKHDGDGTQRKGDEGTNYVVPDGIVPRRHEFLGPDPRVAGYRYDHAGELHIKWWDAFLQDQWMENDKWKFDVKRNADGKWVEIDD